MAKPLFFVIWITAIVVWVFFTRWWVDEKHKNPNHFGQFWLRVFFAFANTFVYYNFRPESMLDGFNDQNLWEVLYALRHWVSLLVLQGIIFWDAFDPLLNYVRDKDAKYVSKSNFFDRFFHRFSNPFKAQLIAKVVATVISILFYALTL